MTKEEEMDYWSGLIVDLNRVMSVPEIAIALDTDERTVWRWKAKDARPLGMKAIRAYLLHIKKCGATDKVVITKPFENAQDVKS